MEKPVGFLEQPDHALPLGWLRLRQRRTGRRFAEVRLQAARRGGLLFDQLRKGIAGHAPVPFARVSFPEPEEVLIGIGARLGLAGHQQLDGAGVIGQFEPRLGLQQDRIREARRGRVLLAKIAKLRLRPTVEGIPERLDRRVERPIRRARRPKPRPAGKQQTQNQYPAALNSHSAATLNQTAQERKEGNGGVRRDA